MFEDLSHAGEKTVKLRNYYDIAEFLNVTGEAVCAHVLVKYIFKLCLLIRQPTHKSAK